MADSTDALELERCPGCEALVKRSANGWPLAAHDCPHGDLCLQGVFVPNLCVVCGDALLERSGRKLAPGTAVIGNPVHAYSAKGAGIVMRYDRLGYHVVWDTNGVVSWVHHEDLRTRSGQRV